MASDILNMNVIDLKSTNKYLNLTSERNFVIKNLDFV